MALDADLSAGLQASPLLAIVAAVLLVFVSGGVLYLSTIEWRDRRRRQAAATPARRASKIPAAGRHRRT